MEKKKIFIIDDSNTIRKSAEMFLSKGNFNVVCFEDGFEALTKITEEKPDLIFIDVIMPKIDGLQACQIIRKNEQFNHVPIIFLSSKDSYFDEARGLLVGANYYLTKPFTKEGLLETVNKFLH